MNLKLIRKRAALLMMAGAVLLGGNQVLTVEASFTNTSLAEKVVRIGKLIEENTKDSFLEMAFLQLEDDTDYVYVREEASEDSTWVGKLYCGDAANVVEPGDEWTKIESGDVIGYVESKNLLVGKIASMKAQSIFEEKYPGTDINSLDEESVRAVFSYAITKEAVKAQERQEVVDFAEQFIGNPYVWGGTSLTRGADCSGFVKSVYANFGISLPRTSYAMRSVGTEVSYSDIQPGDIVCYSGHVGIYAGNGQIVNAIDSAHGIGMSSARYKSIITIRRVIN